jgi:glycerophosphoryl diester phosphodiesterase family protein
MEAATRIRVGDVLSEAAETYQRFFGRLVGTAAVVFVVIDLFAALGAVAAEGTWAAGLVWGLVSVLVSVVGTFWIAGALVLAIDDVRDGRADTPIGELYERVRPQLSALIAAGLLAGIGILIGFVLLIVPGLYLLVRWVLIAPVIVLERRHAGESFGRSTELVRGHGWRVLWVVLVVGLLTSIAHSALYGIFAFMPLFWQTWIGGTIADSVVAPFVAACVTGLYFRLAGRPAASEPT